MKLILNIFMFVFLLNSSVYAQKGKLIVEIREFKNTKGLARVVLFNQSKGFPSEYQYGIRSKSIKLDTTLIYVVFDSLDYGKYALSVLHDENKNGKMDTNFIGIPKEGYGVSNNINPKMRAPRFDEAMFSLGVSEKELKISLSYR
ncbi:MAG: DUF2141 domain-containing protein [Thermodesulfobacteriota bacterium]|nr:DUF2141 domain-containing protein [Thermodesulfobacteriota bacterium]